MANDLDLFKLVFKELAVGLKQDAYYARETGSDYEARALNTLADRLENFEWNFVQKQFDEQTARSLPTKEEGDA